MQQYAVKPDFVKHDFVKHNFHRQDCAEQNFVKRDVDRTCFRPMFCKTRCRQSMFWQTRLCPIGYCQRFCAKRDCVKQDVGNKMLSNMIWFNTFLVMMTLSNTILTKKTVWYNVFYMWSAKLKVAVIWRVLFKSHWKKDSRSMIGSDKLKGSSCKTQAFRISLKEISLTIRIGKTTESDKLKVAVLRSVPFRISLKEIWLEMRVANKNVWKWQTKGSSRKTHSL